MSDEILVRGLSKLALARIDDLAKKKKMSRNAFLVSYIESLAIVSELKELDGKYAALVKDMAILMQENVNLMQENVSSIEQVLQIVSELTLTMGKGNR